MRDKKTRRFFKAIHYNINDDNDNSCGGGGGGGGNNDGAYDYDGYSYYALCDFSLPRSSSSMTEFDCLQRSHK
jgi:hypothetical protein